MHLPAAGSKPGSSSAAGGTLSSEDRKRLQVVGALPDTLLAAQDANDKTSEWAQKSLSVLKQVSRQAGSHAAQPARGQGSLHLLPCCHRRPLGLL